MIQSKFGTFELVKNEKDAFDLNKFEARYLDDVYDKYSYILGDISSEVLRLKGFSTDPKSKNYFHYIPDFIIESCVYKGAYFILKRIKEEKVDVLEHGE